MLEPLITLGHGELDIGASATRREPGATSSTFLWIDQFPGLNGEVDSREVETNGSGQVDYVNGRVPAFQFRIRV